MSFDTVCGLYVFCADYHAGQGSRLYRILSRIASRYRPRLSDRAWAAIRSSAADPGNEWDGAREVYRRLKRAQWDIAQ